MLWGRTQRQSRERLSRGGAVLIDRNTYRGLGLVAVGLTLGWGLSSLGSWAGGSCDAGRVEPTPPVSASSHWAQHAPSRSNPEVEDRTPSAFASGPTMLRPNVRTDFNPRSEHPQIEAGTYVDPMASVIGNVEIGRRVYVAPFVSVRADEGQPIHVGDESNLQDGVVLHALETFSHGQPVPENTYEVQGNRYAIYVGDRVSLANQSQVHGPALVENDVFVGMQALIFRARVGAGSVIEPAAQVIGVHVPPGRYVPAGLTLTEQAAADRLPKITHSYAMGEINRRAVNVNTSLADAYSGRSAPAKLMPLE